MISAALYGLLHFMVAALAHVFFSVFFRPKRFFQATAFFGLVALAFLFFISSTRPSVSYFSSFVFFSLWIGYVVSVACWHNSVTLRFLHSIGKTPQQSKFSREDILNLYNDDVAFERRLDSLQQAQLIKITQNQIQILPRGAMLSKLAVTVRDFFLVKKIG